MYFQCTHEDTSALDLYESYNTIKRDKILDLAIYSSSVYFSFVHRLYNADTSLANKIVDHSANILWTDIAQLRLSSGGF